MRSPQTEPPPEKDEQLWQTAAVLSVLGCPEALRVLRQLDRPRSARDISRAEDGEVTEREATMHLGEFAQCGLVESYSKSGTYRLTELGQLAVRAVRQLGH